MLMRSKGTETETNGDGQQSETDFLMAEDELLQIVEGHILPTIYALLSIHAHVS